MHEKRVFRLRISWWERNWYLIGGHEDVWTITKECTEAEALDDLAHFESQSVVQDSWRQRVRLELVH